MKKDTSVEVNEDLGIYMEQYVSREEQQHEPPYFWAVDTTAFGCILTACIFFRKPAKKDEKKKEKKKKPQLTKFSVPSPNPPTTQKRGEAD